MPRKRKSGAVAKRAPGPPPGPEFKAFYVTLVPAAMRYLVRNVTYPSAQHVAQELAWTFWQAGAKGEEAARALTEPPAAVWHALLREGIVAEWRRARAPRGERQPVHKSAIAALDDLPLDPAVEKIAGWLTHDLSVEECAEVELRLERDPKLFERVSPLVMSWLLLIGPRRQKSKAWSAARRARRKHEGAGPVRGGDDGAERLRWQDYQITERGVDLMWRTFCEVAGARG